MYRNFKLKYQNDADLILNFSLKILVYLNNTIIIEIMEKQHIIGLQ